MAPNITYEQLVSDLTDAIKRAKAQTGELVETRAQINDIDKALRGQGGDGGLIARFDVMNTKLSHLVENQIPDMLRAAETATAATRDARNELMACQRHHESVELQAKNEVERLRAEFEKHTKDEEKEESKFGGREWWRENASGLFISVITAIATTVATAIVVSRIIQP